MYFLIRNLYFMPKYLLDSPHNIDFAVIGLLIEKVEF